MSSKQNVSTLAHADPHTLFSSSSPWSLDIEKIWFLGGLSLSFTLQVILVAVDTSQELWDHVAFADLSIAAVLVSSGDIQPGLSPFGRASLTWS